MCEPDHFELVKTCKHCEFRQYDEIKNTGWCRKHKFYIGMSWADITRFICKDFISRYGLYWRSEDWIRIKKD